MCILSISGSDLFGDTIQQYTNMHLVVLFGIQDGEEEEEGALLIFWPDDSYPPNGEYEAKNLILDATIYIFLFVIYGWG